ncbi:MAG: AsmA family protein [Magnetococcus sp. YQC-5]
MMNRKLRALLYAASGTLFFLVSVVVFTPLLLHPNQYRAPIAALVKNVTGRQLTIRGDVGLSLFPSVQLVLRDLSLANAPEFGSEPMAKAAIVEVGVKFFPLLAGRVEMDRAELMGLNLMLRRNRAGQSNWESLLEHVDEMTRKMIRPVDGGVVTAKPATASANLPASPVVLGINRGGLNIIGAKLSWMDEETGMDFKVTNLDIRTGMIQSARPVLVIAGLHFEEVTRKVRGQADLKYQLRTAPGQIWLDNLELSARATAEGQWIKEVKTVLTTDVAMNTKASTALFTKTDWTSTLWSSKAWWREVTCGLRGEGQMDLGKKQLVLPANTMTALIKANDLPPAGVNWRLTSDLTADMQNQSVKLAHLSLEGPAGMRLKGEMQTKDVLTVPMATGKLSLERLDFRSLLIALGRTIPAPQDARIFAGLDADIQFSIHEKGVELSSLNLGLDDTRVTGDLSWHRSGPSIRFDWVVDTLDLDRYGPLLASIRSGERGQEMVSKDPKDPSDANKAGDAKAVVDVPVKWLTRELLLEGKARVGKLVAGKGHFSDVVMGVRAKDGVMTVDPWKHVLYGGRLDAKARLDLQGPVPVVVVEYLLKEVQSETGLQDMFGLEGVAGRVDLSGRMDFSGQNLEAMTRSLHGDLRLVVSDGVVPGLDVVGRIRNSYAAFNRMRPMASAGAEEIRFVELTATAQVENGVLTSKDLVLHAPGLKMNGVGQVDFVQRRLDAFLFADAGLALQGLASDAELYQGVVAPLQWRTSFEAARKIEMGTVDFSRKRGTMRDASDPPMLPTGEGEIEKRDRGLDQLEKQLGVPVDELLKKILKN